ncbi:MAG: alpha-L-fucosidase [Halanaerobiaceae bacterium]
MISKFNDERDWFFKKRFGLFVHWGLYAIPAWQEQILWRGNMTREKYETLINQFNPVKYNPDKWLDLMEKAGMEYICITTKHHDGFCMFDTEYTDYNIMNTPYGQDVVSQLAEACHRRNIPLGLYYSIPDWHHPNYPNRGRHHEMFGPRAGDDPDREKYLAYVKNQMRELCTNYGEIHQIFWDVNVLEWFEPEVNEMIRSLQPKAIINDRGPAVGDFSTPERHIPEGKEFDNPTEAVQSLGRESWGYKEDEDYYSHKHLMKSIDKIMAMNGNYKLNVGPKADGTIEESNIETLNRIGKWYDKIKESFIDTYPASSLIDNDKVLLTKKENTLYVHFWKEPEKDSIILNPLDIMPERAVLLNNGQELEARVDITPWKWQEKPYLRIRKIPVNKYTDEVMVIKLEFDQSINK